MKNKLIVSALVSTSLISSPLYADEPANMDEAPSNVTIEGGDAQNAENIQDVFDTTSGVNTDGDSLSIRGVVLRLLMTVSA